MNESPEKAFDNNYRFYAYKYEHVYHYRSKLLKRIILLLPIPLQGFDIMNYAENKLTLYQFSTSPFTEKVRRALNYLQLPFEVHEVVRAKVPAGDYKSVSPTGKFPAILDGDKAVWDSTDILIHIDQLVDDRTIIPLDPKKRAWAHIIEDWADESIYFYEIVMRLTWPHNLDSALEEFAHSMPHIPRDKLKGLILEGTSKLTAAQGLGRKPKEQIISDVRRHIESLEQLLDGEDWLAGTLHPSNADFAVAGQLSALLYAEEAREIYHESSQLKDWRSRLMEVAPTENKEAA